MKILYAIQGTGNGHLARATEIVPLLGELGETDVLVSGIQGDLQLPFEIKYRYYGMSFIFGKNGGVNMSQTLKKLKLVKFYNDLKRCPVENYDVVISDFEPVTAWACRVKGKKCIGLSHQNAVLHPNAPKPAKGDWVGEWILQNYAPVQQKYGFHFKKLDGFNFTPVIRPAIRNAIPTKKGHYTVYLPAFSDKKVQNLLSQMPNTRWEVFSKHSKETYQAGNIRFSPVSLEEFTKSFIHCEGILCTAGFETPAEALYMGKKLCVIPMNNQYEQKCNAAFLENMGVTVLNNLNEAYIILKIWLNTSQFIQVNYPDETMNILKEIVMKAER
ncbi:MAG: glycosyl transferase [Bacteroidetes bacterium]|nr:MAG: glycosyl transferase [Bacteroidota bacterium]